MKTKQCPNPPPEEPPQPWHLAHGQVILAGDVEVSDAQEAIAAQVGARSVHGIVEGWDHCGGRAGETREWARRDVFLRGAWAGQYDAGQES